jgi:hypothetical protein
MMKLVAILFGLFLTAESMAQLPFSFERKYLSERTDCLKLGVYLAGSDNPVENDILRFGEPATDNDNVYFRIITYGVPGDAKSVVIHKIERFDSTCMVSIKFLKSLRRKEVFYHAKVYDLSKWTDFMSLVKKNFWEATESTTKVFIHDGMHVQYEFQDGDRYKRIDGTNANPDIVWLHDYLQYLISPIFEDACPSRKTSKRN